MERSYSEMMKLASFDERFRYLKLNGVVGEDIFGSLRALKQRFYTSSEWRRIRNHIIARDLGCDLGVRDRDILDHVYIHHINPITVSDFLEAKPMLTDPENLICCTYDTHLAIHYGLPNLTQPPLIERSRNDTCPWRKG